MGEWYLNDPCISKKLSEIKVEGDFVQSCCCQALQIATPYRSRRKVFLEMDGADSLFCVVLVVFGYLD